LDFPHLKLEAEKIKFIDKEKITHIMRKNFIWWKSRYIL